MADSHRDRQRDAAGIGPYAQDAERLVRLSDLGKWDVADGEPDIRGWEVRTVGGRELGKIKELLVDPDAGEVVMLDVDLSGSHQHALVPLRIVEIDRTKRVVRMDSSDLTPEEREAVAAAEGSSAVSNEQPARERKWADAGRVKYPSHGDEEVIVERRPVVEEVVVRRRLVDAPESGEEVEPLRRADEVDPENRV
jgi:hypothetical protein